LVTSLGAAETLEDAGSTRLREQLAERDEIIVVLQHVIRDLRHEIDNLRAEHAFAALARRGRESSG
jgi:vacuolar-type H+-ATPase subunit F/Vma7